MAQTKEGAIKASAKRRGMSVEEYIKITKKKKWCHKCKSWKLKKHFNIDNTRHDKLYTKCHQCIWTNNGKRGAKKGRPSTFKGKKHSEETKKRISDILKKKYREGLATPPMEGKRHTNESRKKISMALRKNSKKGKDSHSYKDGKLAERRGQRFSKEYKRWRYDVFVRDEFACQKCGDDKGGNLEAHHIKHFCDYPELRFKISNGITYCKNCHKKEHNGELKN